MASHLLLLVVFAFLVSLVFAVIMKDRWREQIKLGGLQFAALVGCALIVAWLMYPFPR